MTPINDDDEYTKAVQSMHALVSQQIQTKDEEADVPVLFMGPPCDEDGHELEDINIC